MKLTCSIVLLSAAMLTAQTPAKKPSPAAQPAATTKSATALASASFDSLADLRRDADQKKFIALDTYLKAHGDAGDAGDATVEAVGLAKGLGRHADVLRLANAYLKANADGSAAGGMKLARAGALADTGDAAGAQKAYEELIEKAGDDIGALVEATTALAEMLVSNGKKDEAVELLGVVGAGHKDVQGLKDHFDGIAANYEILGTEPKALGQNDIDGKPIDLAAYKGKVVMLDFWATWCGPCMAELPNVKAAYEKYHGKGFEIVGISLDKDRGAFDKITSEKKMTWRHHFDGQGWKNEIAQLYGVNSIPATYLIGPDGKVAAVGLRGDALEKQLSKLLAKK
jgi:thiol-disulfide isomerase/thioredoxin